MTVVQIGAAWFPDATSFPELNGLNRYFHELVCHLAAAGERVVAAAYDVVHRPAIAGLTIDSLGRKADRQLQRLRTQRRAIGRCLRERPDLAAFHYAPSVFGSPHSLEDVPLVCHFHGPLSAEHRAEGGGALRARALALVEWRAFRKAKHFIVLSRAYADLLGSLYAIDSDRVSVVPGGVDVRRFQVREGREEARAALALPAHQPLVLAVRQFLHRKGLSNLVEAAAAVVAERPDVSFALVGSGPLESILRRRIAAEGLDSNVRVIGSVPERELPLWYRAADLTIVPSVAFEGFGLSAIESLAAGTPAVGTPIDGLREALEPLAPSLVLAGTSPDDLARGLLEALRGDRRLPEPAACVGYVAAHFDWSVVVGRMRAIYAGLINRSEAE